MGKDSRYYTEHPDTTITVLQKGVHKNIRHDSPQLAPYVVMERECEMEPDTPFTQVVFYTQLAQLKMTSQGAYHWRIRSISFISSQ